MAHDLWFQFLDNSFLFEIPDLDDWSGRSTEPVSVWREAKGVDFFSSVKSVKGFGFFTSEVPEFGLSVSATGGAERTVWGYGDGVQVSGVSSVVPLELAVGEVPDFDQLVPSGRYNNWILGKWRKSDTGHPLGVALLLDGVLANSQSVPQLDGSVASGRNDLTVVSRESDREDVLGVSNKSSGSVSTCKIPESEGSVP